MTKSKKKKNPEKDQRKENRLKNIKWLVAEEKRIDSAFGPWRPLASRPGWRK